MHFIKIKRPTVKILNNISQQCFYNKIYTIVIFYHILCKYIYIYTHINLTKAKYFIKCNYTCDTWLTDYTTYIKVSIYNKQTSLNRVTLQTSIFQPTSWVMKTPGFNNIYLNIYHYLFSCPFYILLSRFIGLLAVLSTINYKRKNVESVYLGYKCKILNASLHFQTKLVVCI